MPKLPSQPGSRSGNLDMPVEQIPMPAEPEPSNNAEPFSVDRLKEDLMNKFRKEMEAKLREELDREAMQKVKKEKIDEQEKHKAYDESLQRQDIAAQEEDNGQKMDPTGRV